MAGPDETSGESCELHDSSEPDDGYGDHDEEGGSCEVPAEDPDAPQPPPKPPEKPKEPEPSEVAREWWNVQYVPPVLVSFDGAALADEQFRLETFMFGKSEEDEKLQGSDAKSDSDDLGDYGVVDFGVVVDQRYYTLHHRRPGAAEQIVFEWVAAADLGSEWTGPLDSHPHIAEPDKVPLTKDADLDGYANDLDDF